MLISLSLIIMTGFALKGIFQKIGLPGLLGMLLSGILLGPHVLNLISPDILMISADLRKIALIVILVRAGLSLDLRDLKKVGRPALLMCFLPASFEIIGVVLLGPWLLHISYLEAAILGAILGAVSPAIVVPKMINLMEQGLGKQHNVPQLIMAGASVDGVFNIVMFTTFMGLFADQGFSPVSILKVPASIVTGLFVGIGLGFILSWLFKLIHIRDTVKVMIILGVSFLIVGLESQVSRVVPFSGLLAVIAMGSTILKSHEVLAKRIAGKFNKIWVAAELIVFVLLGAVVDIRYIPRAGWAVVALILGALAFRSIGVLISVSWSGIPPKERLFCIIAYWPKATVQAALGALPLAAGVASGSMILTAAVISILITAPLGEIGIDKTYRKLLT